MLIDSSTDGSAELFAKKSTASCLVYRMTCQSYQLSFHLHTMDPTPALTSLRIESSIICHESSGPDGLPNLFLRAFAFAISEPISHKQRDHSRHIVLQETAGILAAKLPPIAFGRYSLWIPDPIIPTYTASQALRDRVRAE
jgi:hypothetical protein